MRPLLLRLRALPQPALVAALAMVLVAAGLGAVLVIDDDGPTKVAVGTPTTTTVHRDEKVPDGGTGPDGSTTSTTTVSVLGRARTPIPATTPIPSTSTTSTTAGSTTSTTKPKQSTTTTTTTTPGGEEPEPIVYPSGPGDPLELGHVYVVGIADGQAHKIASHPEVFDRSVWSPDGRRVLFAVDDPERRVYTVKADGSDPIALPGGGIETPVWSAQGDLAVIVYDGTGHNLRINKVDGNVRTITHQQVGPVSGREWSPDGSTVALVAGGRVWIADSNGENVVPITPAGKAWKWLKWSPDGTRIAYQELERLKVVQADGSGVVDLGPVNADPSFSWSPDGTELVLCLPFGSSPRLGIGIVPASGGPVRSLGVQGFEVSWSPDGNHILYKSYPFQNNTAPLKLISPDGTNNRLWLSGVNFGLGLNWSPSSTHVLLNTGEGKAYGVEQPLG